MKKTVSGEEAFRFASRTSTAVETNNSIDNIHIAKIIPSPFPKLASRLSRVGAMTIDTIILSIFKRLEAVKKKSGNSNRGTGRRWYLRGLLEIEIILYGPRRPQFNLY